MAAKNALLGGTDWSAGDLYFQDLNDTFDRTVTRAVLMSSPDWPADFDLFDNEQIFTADGTWTKPSGASYVFVQVWGAGGAGGSQVGGSTPRAGGGGGGAYSSQWFKASDLDGTVSVTVGDGGLGVEQVDGNDGDDSSFGTHVVSGGGKGGERGTTNPREGGDGGLRFGFLETGVSVMAGSNYLTLQSDATDRYAGAGGIGPSFRGGHSEFGGAGGGGDGAGGGQSLHAGNGGGGSRTVGVDATDGVAPAGGGGAYASSTGSPAARGGHGARGEVRVYTIL